MLPYSEFKKVNIYTKSAVKDEGDSSMDNTWKSIKNIFQKLIYILPKKEKKASILILVMTIVGAIFETLGVSIIIPLMQALLDPLQLLELPIVGRILEFIHAESSGEIVIWVAIGVVLIYICKNLYMTLLSFCRAKFSCDIQHKLSVKMMKLFMQRGYAYFLGINTGDILKGIKNDTDSIQYMISNLLRMGADILTILFICFFVLMMDFKMAVCIMFLIFFSLFLVLFVYRKQMIKLGHRYQKYVAIVNKYALQACQGIKEIIVNHRQTYFINCYEEAYAIQQKAVTLQNVAAEIPAYAIEAICVIGMILFLCIKMLSGMDTAVFIPQLGAVAMAAFRILPSMGKLSGSANVLMYYSPAVEAVYDNFKNGESMSVEESKINEKIVFQRILELKDVHWKYNGAENEVLSGINIKIEKGTSVAFIGQSGSGKTTIADIMLGLLKPQQGGVYIDGINVFSIPVQWSQIIGYIPQSIYLLDDTIRNNVAFGRKKEEIDDKVIWNVLEKAQLSMFVRQLPQGLDTIVGDRGVRFSGGQRQRIAIARALYHDPDILVMDEATSALDSETEEAVMKSIEILQKQKTIIIIAHRISTIKKCDVIYEVSNGNISKVNVTDII